MEERFAAFTVLIAKINRNIRRIKTEEMAEFHLKGPHVACLYHLTTAGPLTAGELCDRCDEDKAAISRSLDFLEKEGYLVCDSSARKRYRSPLRLTEKGEATGRRIMEKIDRIVRLRPDGGGAGRDVSRAFRRQRAAGPNGGNQNERGGPAG